MFTKAHASRKAPRSRASACSGTLRATTNTRVGAWPSASAGPADSASCSTTPATTNINVATNIPAVTTNPMRTAKPGDPAFQWDCFGLAMGMGRRVFPPDPDSLGYNLAGGIGMVIEFRALSLCCLIALDLLAVGLGLYGGARAPRGLLRPPTDPLGDPLAGRRGRLVPVRRARHGLVFWQAGLYARARAPRRLRPDRLVAGRRRAARARVRRRHRATTSGPSG